MSYAEVQSCRPHESNGCEPGKRTQSHGVTNPSLAHPLVGVDPYGSGLGLPERRVCAVKAGVLLVLQQHLDRRPKLIAQSLQRLPGNDVTTSTATIETRRMCASLGIVRSEYHTTQQSGQATTGGTKCGNHDGSGSPDRGVPTSNEYKTTKTACVHHSLLRALLGLWLRLLLQICCVQRSLTGSSLSAWQAKYFDRAPCFRIDPNTVLSSKRSNTQWTEDVRISLTALSTLSPNP